MKVVHREERVLRLEQHPLDGVRGGREGDRQGEPGEVAVVALQEGSKLALHLPRRTVEPGSEIGTVGPERLAERRRVDRRESRGGDGEWTELQQPEARL